MPLTTFDEGRIVGERTSPQPVVVALHGWGRDHHDFDTALAPFPHLAVDLPGFGLSPPPDEAWGSLEYAKALSPVFESFPEPPVVVGHSFGGRVALQLAGALGVPLKALVLTGVPLTRGQQGRSHVAFGYRVVRGLHRLHLVGPDRMERTRQRYGSDDYRKATGVMRDVLVRAVNETYDDLLPRVSCPVELVWAEGDTAAPVDGARRAATLFPDARLTVVSGGNHFTVLRDPEALRDAVSRHLA